MNVIRALSRGFVAGLIGAALCACAVPVTPAARTVAITPPQIRAPVAATGGPTSVGESAGTALFTPVAPAPD